MNKVKEVIEAWSISRNPTKEQKELAELRYEICNACPHLTEKLGHEICGACGCPISKKVFSPNRSGACPKDKWSEIDEKFD